MAYQEELKSTGAEGIKFDFKPLVEALAMDSYQVSIILFPNDNIDRILFEIRV